MALLGKLGIELKKDLMDFDAVGCAIEMGLPSLPKPIFTLTLHILQ
jgi:hypothetical protein